jgi:hypothetical protein
MPDGCYVTKPPLMQTIGDVRFRRCWYVAAGSPGAR